MPQRSFRGCLLAVSCLCSPLAALGPVPVKVAAKTVEQIAAAARSSVVIITFAGRDGKRQGLGTGFVVAADGLIATNLHVLGDARPIKVQLADGRQFEVTTIHASDRSLDLALIRIDAKNLTALELGDPDGLKEGQAVVALGNPLGLANSVVSGIVSGKREVEGRPMIQLAIPIEPGNSGGPLLDLQGRVHGIITMKSALTANLGFAVPIDLLQPLLKRPNPIPMARWITIGTLDPAEWTTVFDARWRQRAGKIVADGLGTGFGGRSLALCQRPTPQLPYEVAVTVRLDDESGAAGLVFHADGAEKHYGFYPSAGQLRLTRFDGPDVFSWKILLQKPSPHYRLGEWNVLKVRLEIGKVLCYVNEQLVMESTDHELKGGKVGLAKFRDTRAEFKDFQVAREIFSKSISPELSKKIMKLVEEKMSRQETLQAKMIDELLPAAPASVSALRDRAKLLEQQAGGLRELALAIHQKRVESQLIQALQSKEQEIDLFAAALLIAKLDNDELDTNIYRTEMDRLARGLQDTLPKTANDNAKLAALKKYFFTERGFHGSRSDYYNRANSYLSDVIDDREGLPITLSILYMELARRIGLHVVGIGLPGHFVVQHAPAQGETQLIDVFEGGELLSRTAANQRIEAITGRKALPADFAPVSKKAILIRMLHNLLGITRRDGDLKGALRYLDTIVAIAPQSSEERLMRASVRFQLGSRQGCLEDIDWLLDHRPQGIDVERVLELRRMLSRPDR